MSWWRWQCIMCAQALSQPARTGNPVPELMRQNKIMTMDWRTIGTLPAILLLLLYQPQIRRLKISWRVGWNLIVTFCYQLLFTIIDSFYGLLIREGENSASGDLVCPNKTPSIGEIGIVWCLQLCLDLPSIHTCLFPPHSCSCFLKWPWGKESPEWIK